MPVVKSPLIVAGVDVGGPKKGFHAVALQGGAVLGTLVSLDPAQVAAWCRENGAQVVGVDAPCRWSVDGHARPAERELMAAGIWCFATPTRRAAEAHPTGYYRWMLAGAELFRQLETTYGLYAGARVKKGEMICFEKEANAALRMSACGLTQSGAPMRLDAYRVLPAVGMLR